MNNLIAKSILACLDSNHSIRIALSGGIDSVSLLVACHELRSHGQISYFDAIYVNHLSNYSKDAEKFCQSLCQKLNIDLTITSIDAEVTSNKEAQWRKQRYEKISELTPLMTHVFLGHHQNDQAETFLLNAFRGTGLKGLQGMSKFTTHHKKRYKRPFMDIQRSHLENFLFTKQVTWIEDPSNQDNLFKRNFIRNKIIPLLMSQWPSVTQTLSRTATNLSVESTIESNIFKLRQWLASVHIHLEKKRLTNIYYQLANSTYDRTKKIPLDGYDLYKHKQNLYLITQTKPYKQIDIDLTQKTHYSINDYLSIEFKKVAYGLGVDKQFINELSIRPRQGGETIQLSENQPHQKIKKLIQQYKLPIYLKINTPLLYFKNELIGVPGFLLKQSFSTHQDSYQISLASLTKNNNRILILKNTDLFKL